MPLIEYEKRKYARTQARNACTRAQLPVAKSRDRRKYTVTVNVYDFRKSLVPSQNKVTRREFAGVNSNR